ncbi:YciI family protein [Variovorax sp. MHTC-1]|uniref:YciI family protein n=1 Tax=Variovorax sp. MHTC-1 TaxID=2495593 RepID=UPI0039183397
MRQASRRGCVQTAPRCVRGDKRQVQDGPFADTKEQLGGYFVMVPDLDTALEWAARALRAGRGRAEPASAGR